MAGKRLSTIKRHNLIGEMILRGHPARVIVRLLMKAGIEVALGTVYNDMSEIRKEWLAYLAENLSGNAGADFLQRAFDMRRKAEEGGDLKLAYAITKDIANLLGVSLAERHEIETIGPVDIQVVWRNGRKE